MVCQDGCARHLCGHDGHSAILAGLALALEGIATARDVYLIFQPAEETGQGAAAGLKVSFLQEPMRWSEDFGHYLQKTKGAFFGIGCGKEHTGLHTAGYEFDDEIIESAIAMYSQLVLQATAIASKVVSPSSSSTLCLLPLSPM